VTRGPAAGWLGAACALGLVAAVLAVGDTMATALATSATRGALERDYVARTGSTADQAYAVVGSGLAGSFIVGLAFAAAIAVLALRALAAGRGVRGGLVVCTVLALPAALGGPWAAGRALALVAALACVVAPPAVAAFHARAAALQEGSAGDPPRPPRRS
jgi:hypothetical protein